MENVIVTPIKTIKEKLAAITQKKYKNVSNSGNTDGINVQWRVL